MRNLNDPDTELAGFFQGLGRAAGETAPVASTQAAAVRQHGRHLRGDDRDPGGLQDSISEGVPTQIQAIRSSASSSPSCATSPTSPAGCGRPRASFRARSRRSTARCWWAPTCCRGPSRCPTACATRSTPSTTSARTPTRCSRSTTSTCSCARKPGAGLRRALPDGLQLRDLLPEPARHPHLRARCGGGTLQRVQLKLPTRPSRTRSPSAAPRGRSTSSRARTTSSPAPNPPATLHGNPVRPGDRRQRQRRLRGRPDRLRGPLLPRTALRPERAGRPQGGARAPTSPGLRGGTYKARQLGIDNLRDVP